jgi:hypothetical protein
MRDNRPLFPIWVGGILLGILLILLSTRGGDLNSMALERRFAPDPNAPKPAPFQLPQVSLPSLPAGMQQTLIDLRDRFALGQAIPALTPVASGPRVRIEVGEIKRNGEQVKISGTVTNISNAPLEIGLSAFSFRDSVGVSYAASGASTTLRPGQSTALDLALPLPQSRGLTLVITLPPDPPIEQVLMVETKT